MLRRVRHVAAGAILAWIVTLVAAPGAEAAPSVSAEAAPSVTYKCTPAPQNCTGWYRSDVSIEWTVLPSDATKTGCANQTFTTDTPVTSVYCSADDGSAATSVEVRIKVDKTPPVITGGRPSRAADVSGWYNHAVGVEFSGSDLTSGVSSCTATTYGGPDSVSANVQGTCIDNAGNVSAPLGYGLKYDATAPAVNAARPERQPNAAGWFNRAVTFDIEGSDETSGIADCAPVGYGGPDSASASIIGTCQDQAGNSANRTFALKYDSTAPTVAGGQAARPADVNGWYNEPVAVNFTGADQLSGVEACTATTYNGPDAGSALVPGACTDRAGNVSPSLSFPLKYDATAPTATGSQAARQPGTGGWYSAPVAIAFSGTDGMSGVDTCANVNYSGPDDATGSVSGTCTDKAGNVSAPREHALKYDATAPAVTAAEPDRGANANGWYNRAVGFTVRGTDETSGIAQCPGTSYSGPDDATASVVGRCTDNAGNASSREFALKYDATAPAATGSQAARAPGTSGWYTAPVAIAFSGTDGLSGVDSCPTVTYSGPDNATASVPGTCTDKAGNVSPPRGHALKYDATAPTVTRGAPERAANAEGWYNRAVTIGFTGTDPVSGVETCTNTTYGGPDSAQASVNGTCTDKAGNTSTQLPFGLKYDATAPQVTTGSPERNANANGWYNSSVGFTFDGTDATSGVAGCPSVSYTGPESATASVLGRCTDKAGNVGDRAFPLKYDATAPTTTGSQAARQPGASGWYTAPVEITFSGADGLSGLGTCSTVTYAGPDTATASVPGSCTDMAGNVSASRGHALKYDATAPTVTGGTPDRAANPEGWYNRVVAITFAGTDPVSGVAACTSTNYSGPDNGAATVDGTCSDKAGNTSSTFPFGLKYDATVPTVTAADPQRPPNPKGWFKSAVDFTIRGTDLTSGVAACPAASYSGPDAAAGSVIGRCTDRAGNSADRPFPIKYDATAPTVTGGQPTRVADEAGWFNHAVPVAFSGTDPVSGVEACPTVTYAGPDSATASVPGTCTDNAGNVSAPRGHVIRYDATGPTVTGGTPDRAANAGGWYNRSVAVTFAGTDPVSGVKTCAGATYAGPDSATASVSGTCTDTAGNTSPAFPFGLKYDATSPQVTSASPRRGPDTAGDWYNHPVEYTFEGADATSGIDACPPVTYAAPDSAEASTIGRCTDKAGNAADRAFPLKYDGTAPAVSKVTADRPPNGAGWYNGPVTLTFVGDDATAGVGGCTTRTYNGPDNAAASVSGTCTDAAGNVSGTFTHTLKYDTTAPTVTRAEPGRPPNDDDWYNRAVSIGFSGDDVTSGVDACTNITYAGPDTAATLVPGTCRDKAGNISDELSFGLKFDGTGPEVTGGKWQREPDHAGWFVSPVRLDVSGTDALSGLHVCPPVTYSGPDGAGAVVASCRDKAGNSTSRSFPLKYDGTAPLLTSLVAAGGDRSVSLSWRTTPDTVSVAVLRTPGLDAQARSEVYRGMGSSFVDRRVNNGVRYEYEFELRDAADNVRRHKVVALPATPDPIVLPPPSAPVPGVVVPPVPSPFVPAPGSVLRAGKAPLLRWPRADRARYYNVQLFRGGRKILSVWPLRAQHRLKLRWKFRGERRRLSPGRYRWMVWPGYGKRSKADFGKRIVNSTFTIKRGGSL